MAEIYVIFRGAEPMTDDANIGWFASSLEAKRSVAVMRCFAGVDWVPYVPAAERDQLKRERDEARMELVREIATDSCAGYCDVTVAGLRGLADERWGPCTGAELFPEEES